MSETPAVYDVTPVRPLSLAEVKSQIATLQDILKHVMQKDQHYGTIPGAGPKPTLLKPGAEKIMTTFQLWPDPEVEDLSFNDILRYRVKVKLINKVSGIVEGAGVGECSSEEEKYKWRAVVSEAEWNATPDTHRRIKFTKYKDNPQIKQIRTNPYDLANTIVKMAKKRALVDAVLTATAASDIFTQDIEEMPEEYFSQGKPVNGNGAKQDIKPPQSKGEVGETLSVNFIPSDIKEIKGTNRKTGKPFTKFIVKNNDMEFNTFSETFVADARAAMEGGMLIAVTYKSSQYGNDIISIGPAVYDDEPGEQGE